MPSETEAQGPPEANFVCLQHTLFLKAEGSVGCLVEFSGLMKRWQSALGPESQPHSVPLPQRRKNWVKGGRRLPTH